MKNSTKWYYTDRDYFISDNPYSLDAAILLDEMYDMGFITLEGSEDFVFWNCNFISVPLHIKIRHYEIQVNEIAYSILNGYNYEYDLDEFYYACKMLMKHTIDEINNRHCR